MGFDGSGNYTRTNGTLSGSTLWQQRAAQANPVISATEHDAEMNDVATALTACLKANGSKAATGNQPMGGFKHTGVADATANNQYVTYGQVTSTGVPDVFVDEPGTAATATATVRLRCGGVGASIGGLYAHNTASTTYGGEALELNTFAPNLIFGTGGFEKARIDASGNLGIGTTTPGDQIHIKGTSPRIRFEDSDAASSAIYSRISGNATDGSLFLQADPEFAAANSTIVMQVDNNEIMRLTSNGRVGINNTIPGTRLHVRTTETTTAALALQSDVAGDASSALQSLLKTDNNSTTSQIFVKFAINGGLTGSGQINANGASAAAFGTFSDARLKENVENLPDTLPSVMQLRPVEFDYRDGAGHQIGFIAQEVREIWPDVVAPDQDGFLMISGLGKTEARLIKAIQSLAAKVESLEARIAAMEAL